MDSVTSFEDTCGQKLIEQYIQYLEDAMKEIQDTCMESTDKTFSALFQKCTTHITKNR